MLAAIIAWRPTERMKARRGYVRRNAAMSKISKMPINVLKISSALAIIFIKINRIITEVM